MCDEWMPVIRVPMAFETFERLPQNAAYKYEYWDGQAVLSPRPKTFHARLDCSREISRDDQATDEHLELILATSADREHLADVFCGAFSRTQPFASLTDAERRVAAVETLRRTFDGEEGPFVKPASFALVDRQHDHLAGAILVTLIPDGDPGDIERFHWKGPPPADVWESGRGRPHLTWAFTNLWRKGEGIGTRLLAEAIRPLRARGDRWLFSTFLAGNDSSQLWHWRNGFELLPYFASRRKFLKKV